MYRRIVLPPTEPLTQGDKEMLRTNVLFKHIQVCTAQWGPLPGNREDRVWKRKGVQASEGGYYQLVSETPARVLQPDGRTDRRSFALAAVHLVLMVSLFAPAARATTLPPSPAPAAAHADPHHLPHQRGWRLLVQHPQAQAAARRRVSDGASGEGPGRGTRGGKETRTGLL
jgi:hypothetical protein